MHAQTLKLDAQVEALLTEAHLPICDLADGQGLHLLGVRQGARLVGVVGVEVHGHVGLLRSLAVAAAHRNSGLGIGLVSDAEAWAAAHGIGTLYLLTTTAARFFARLGYEQIPRAAAPDVIAATAQFTGLCPASSTLMRKALPQNPSRPARRS